MMQKLLSRVTTSLLAREGLGVGLLLLGLLCFSCKEKSEADEYDNWRERNEHYVDSIATLARSGQGGWTMYKAYNLGDSLNMTGPNKYYIYVQKLEEGTGDYHPLYNDSVRVHYTGNLLPTDTYPQGYNFDRSFRGSVLNEATDVPTLLAPAGVVVGFGTALMHMVKGDRWRVVIPSYLGYGTTDNSSASIPAHSTLIFELTLSRIYRYTIDTDTSWH